MWKYGIMEQTNVDWVNQQIPRDVVYVNNWAWWKINIFASFDNLTESFVWIIF
jgi:hypothetical protein